MNEAPGLFTGCLVCPTGCLVCSTGCLVCPQGASCVPQGAGLVGIVMACELFPAVHRTFAGAALELFWAAGWMTLALLAYLIRDWRHLQLAVTLPAIWTICLIWSLAFDIL